MSETPRTDEITHNKVLGTTELKAAYRELVDLSRTLERELSALSLREREGMVEVPKILLGQIATMLEYARCVTSDKDADTTFAKLRDAVRELFAAAPPASPAGEEKL